MSKRGDSIDNVTVDCKVQSQPPADVVIYRDNRQGDRVIVYSDTDDDSDVRVTHDTNDDTSTYTVHLESLDISMFGDYTCSASNILGTQRKTVKVAGKKVVILPALAPSVIIFIIRMANCVLSQDLTRPLTVLLLQSDCHACLRLPVAVSAVPVQ